jgi:hypothetical protein
VTLDAIERIAREAVVSGAPERSEALEALVSTLIADIGGFGRRATDGLVLLREELSETSYFAVGLVYLIKDQSRQPVGIDLIFTPGGDAIASGRLRFGRTSTDDAPVSEGNLEKALTAYPREAASALDWAYVLERSSNGWSRTRRPQNNKMQRTSHG